MVWRKKLNKLKTYALLEGQQVGIRLGLVPSQTDYVRFLILGQGRTGSNLLRGLINSHPNALAYYELFRQPTEIDWGFPGYRTSSTVLRQFQTDPLIFLEKSVFKPFPNQVQAVGFKLFYNHAQTAVHRPVWSYLRQQPRLHVLHIKRQNYLETFLSLKRAEQSKQWVATTKSALKEIPPIQLDFDQCLASFEQTAVWEAQYSDFFANHPVHNVIYERLAANHTDEMRQVFNFLNLPTHAVQPQTFKQRRKPLAEAIANYDELRTRFDNTPFAKFFDASLQGATA